jgi:cobalamin biosynthesis protein CobD/CbiB
MSFLEPILAGMLTRAETLVPLLVAALLVGEPLARVTGIRRVILGGEHLAARLERKLNREHRGVATRVYRGMIALGMMIALAAALAFALAQPHPIAHWLMLVLVIAVLGHGMASASLISAWRAAKAGTQVLTLPGLNFLFADSHGVIRYQILHHAERFAIYTVGAALWYSLAGVAGMLGYLAVADAARFGNGAAFGWAATALFRLLDALPKAITALLLTVAALFVSGAKPLAARGARSFHGLVAALTACALGGMMPGRELPWVGTGTPKATTTHLARFGLIQTAAGLLLVLALSARQMLAHG